MRNTPKTKTVWQLFLMRAGDTIRDAVTKCARNDGCEQCMYHEYPDACDRIVKAVQTRDEFVSDDMYRDLFTIGLRRVGYED